MMFFLCCIVANIILRYHMALGEVNKDSVSGKKYYPKYIYDFCNNNIKYITFDA